MVAAAADLKAAARSNSSEAPSPTTTTWPAAIPDGPRTVVVFANSPLSEIQNEFGVKGTGYAGVDLYEGGKLTAGLGGEQLGGIEPVRSARAGQHGRRLAAEVGDIGAALVPQGVVAGNGSRTRRSAARGAGCLAGRRNALVDDIASTIA